MKEVVTVVIYITQCSSSVAVQCSDPYYSLSLIHSHSINIINAKTNFSFLKFFQIYSYRHHNSSSSSTSTDSRAILYIKIGRVNYISTIFVLIVVQYWWSTYGNSSTSYMDAFPVSAN